MRNSPRVKHIPQRTCLGCRQVKPKRELIRLVATANGVTVDPSGKKSGRGVYLCPSPSCWEEGLKKEKLDKALRIKITLEDKEKLKEFAKEL